MTTMTDSAWRTFVSEGGRLGSVAVSRADGRPHATPVCFVLDGPELVFTTSPASVKGAYLTRDSRVAVCVSDESHPYGFVLIEGEAATSPDPDEFRRVAKAIAARYYPGDDAEAFADELSGAGFVVVRVRVTNVIARSDLG